MKMERAKSKAKILLFGQWVWVVKYMMRKWEEVGYDHDQAAADDDDVKMTHKA